MNTNVKNTFRAEFRSTNAAAVLSWAFCGLLAASGGIHAQSASSAVAVPGIGAVSPTDTTGSVAIARDESVHTTDQGSYHLKLPLAIAPDARRKFTASGREIMETGLVAGVDSKTHGGLPAPGEIVAIGMHPGGDKLYVVTEIRSEAPSALRKLAAGSVNASDPSGDFGNPVFITWLDVSEELNSANADSTRWGPNVELTGPARNVSDMAVSPDGGFALVTAKGETHLPLVTPFGVLPTSDDATAGVFVVDLVLFEQAGFFPSAMRGENTREVRMAVASQARAIRHPNLVIAERNFETSQAKLAVAGSSVSAFGFVSGAHAEFLANSLNLEEMHRVYSKFGLLASYAYTYPYDMVAPTGVGISNRGDLAMVTMEKTNNIGVIPVPVFSDGAGRSLASVSPLGFDVATPKTVNGQNIDFSISADGAAANSRFAYWGPADVAFAPDDSQALVGAYGGRLNAYGVIDIDANRDSIFGGNLGAGFVALEGAGTFERPAYPKHVAGRPAIDNDGDGLSNHLEAFNRWNDTRTIKYGEPSKLAGIADGAQADINAPERDHVAEDGRSRVHYLLPHSGVGYRFDYLGQERYSVNSGNKATVAAIEKLGWAWHESSPSRPYFMVQNIAHPGGGFMRNRSGELQHYTERMGDAVNLSYFSEGSDDAFDVVKSNGPGSPLDNTLASLAEMDTAATFALLDLLLTHPDIRDRVKEIWIDPLVKQAYGIDSSKFVLRGSVDPDSSLRRDCDSFMKVVFGQPGGIEIVVDGAAGVIGDDGGVTYYQVETEEGDLASGVPVQLFFSDAQVETVGFPGDVEVYYDKEMNDRIETTDAQGNPIYHPISKFENDPVFIAPGSDLTVNGFDGAENAIADADFSVRTVGVSLTLGSPTVLPPDALGIPGYADGYDLDRLKPEDLNPDRIPDDADNSAAATIAAGLTATFTGADPDALVRISYQASSPGAVSRFTRVSGSSPFGFNTYYQLPDAGVIRLWRNGEVSRDLTDFVGPGTYRLSELNGGRLFLEAVKGDFLGVPVEIALDPDGDGPAGFLAFASATVGDAALLAPAKTELGFGEAATVTVARPGEKARLVYDTRFLEVVDFPPGSYPDGLPAQLTVKSVRPTTGAGDTSLFVELTSPASVGAVPPPNAALASWSIREVPVTPAVTRVDAIDLRARGPAIEWSREHHPEFFLDPLHPEDEDADRITSTRVLAVTEPENRSVKYAVAEWTPERFAGISPHAEPKLDEDTGEITAGDTRGELYVYAYDAELPSLQTRPLRITVGECKSCTVACIDARGELRCELEEGIDTEIDLGEAGSLHLRASNPSPLLASPDALEYPYDAGRNVAVYDETRTLRQIAGEDVFVDIVRQNHYKYTLSVFDRSSIVGSPDADGIHPVPSGVPPVTTLIVQNPSPREYPHGERLVLTHIFEGKTTIRQYDFDEAESLWALKEIDPDDEDVIREKTVRTYAAQVAPQPVEGQGMEEEIIVKDGEGGILAKSRLQYIENELGSILTRDTEVRPEDPDLVTDYVYNSAARLVETRYPDGSAQSQSYTAEGNLAEVTEPWTGGTPGGGTGGETADTIRTLYDYELNDDLGDTDRKRDAVRTVTTKVGTHVLSTVRHAYGSGFMRRSDNGLVTTTHYVTNADYGPSATYAEDAPDFRGRVKRVIHPDGTETRYTYAQNKDAVDNFVYDTTVTVQRGVPSADGAAIVDGTRSLTTTDHKDQTLFSETVDIASGIVTGLQQATAFDAFDRITEYTYLDGRTTERQYGCCGVLWEEDRLGIRTHYTYDDLDRLETMTRLGVTTTYHYDGLGRQNKVTQTALGEAATIVQSRTEYTDSTGLEYTTYDAMDRPTTVETSYSAGGTTTTTTTLPGGFTQIQKYDRSGSLVSTSGTAATPMRYEQRIETYQGKVHTVQKSIAGLDPDGSEWVEQWSDALGRNVRTVYPGGAEETRSYNDKGQLAATTDADGVTTLYAYNDLGEQTLVAVDTNRDGTIQTAEPGATDIVTETEREYLTATVEGTAYEVMRATTTVHTATGTVEIAVSESTVDGLRSWSTRAEATSTREVIYPDTPDAASPAGGEPATPVGGSYEVHSIAADDSYQIQLYTEGRLSDSAAYAADGTLLNSAGYGYDGFGRQNEITDPRAGATTFTYFADGQIDTITAPDPEQLVGTLVTSHHYNDRGLLRKRILPDLSEVHFTYNALGQLEKTWGSQTYPVEYSYTAQGRLETMTTWQDFEQNQDAAVTRWEYDPRRGWLDKKYDAENEFVDHDYTPAGRLQTRTWARGITTAYDYNSAGQLATTDYSDDTPDIHYSYYRHGQIEEVRDGVLTGAEITDADLRYRHSYTYDASLRLATERIQTHGDMTLTRSYETGATTGEVPGRYRGFALAETGVSGALAAATYGYDNAGRLSSVSAADPAAGLPANPDFVYRYRTDASLIDRIEGPVHTALYAYQPRGNQVRSIINHTADPTSQLQDFTTSQHSSVVSRYDYRHNKLGQRTHMTQSGTAFENIPELPGAQAFFDYAYNGKGEVTGAARYLGDPEAPGAPVDPESFAYDFDDIGNRLSSAFGTNTTTYEADLLNQYEIITDLPSSSSHDPVHDLDGHLKQDDRFAYTWNGENRLVTVTPLNPQEEDKRLTFSYDYQGRRVSKAVEEWDLDSNSYLPSSSLAFSYDGWNLISEISNSESQIETRKSFLWGLDLSGSLQGAGGVGGLLQTTNNEEQGTKNFYSLFDANGNVTQYLDETAATVAHYEYGPFGESIRATGTKAQDFNFRFSTKYEDSETGFLYYGFRYYDPRTGRWLSRDPIEENGGINLYGMVGNSPVGSVDYLGRVEFIAQNSKVSAYWPKNYLGIMVSPSPVWRGVDDLNFDRSRDYTPAWVMTCKCGIIDLGHVRHALDRVLKYYLELQWNAARNNGIVVAGTQIPGVEHEWRVGRGIMSMDIGTGRLDTIASDIPRANIVGEAYNLGLNEAYLHEVNGSVGFLDEMSKFAPDDLFSNLMGAEAARDILSSYTSPKWPSEREWLDSIQKEVEKRLKACIPLSAEEARGVWADESHHQTFIESMPYKSYDPLNFECSPCKEKLKNNGQK